MFLPDLPALLRSFGKAYRQRPRLVQTRHDNESWLLGEELADRGRSPSLTYTFTINKAPEWGLCCG